MISKIYKSKISWGILIGVTTLLTATAIVMILSNAWIGVIINAIVLLFIFYLYKTTFYLIEGEMLIIKSGIFKRKINIKTIRKIKKTNNPLSSPALSIDRIEIIYNRYNTILISPKSKEAFVQHLLQIQPNIDAPDFKS